MTDATLFDRLLVPLDGTPRSEEALPYALAVAGDRAAITVLHVVHSAQPLRKPLGQILKTAEEVLAELSAEALADLHAAVERSGAAAAGATVDPVVRFGNPADTILDVADEVGAGAIVLTSSGRGLISRLALGSVAERVARESARPTLLVRQSELGESGESGAEDSASAPSIARLVVPLDGSERGKAALPVASALAGRLGAPVALISVVEPSSSMMGSAVPVSPAGGAVYTDLSDAVDAVTRQGLADAARELTATGVTVSTELARGPAAGAIIDFTGPGDLIVMTSRGHGGFSRLVLGSVAETLVREAPAPVLIVPSTE